MKVFCDMDGVLVDFIGGMNRAHKSPSPWLKRENLGKWGAEDMWGLSNQEWWAPAGTEEFWKELAQTKECYELIHTLCKAFGQDNVALLTAPLLIGPCITGKMAWIDRYTPEFHWRTIFGSAKEFMAGPDKLLVDDSDRNIQAFRQAGGQGILVPRLWNSDYALADKTMEVLIDRIAKESI